MFFSSVQFSSVTQLCPTLCNSMNCIMPGLPVHHQLPEFTQTHIHWDSDAIQPVMPSSHLILCRPLLLLPQSLPASGSFSMSQLFAWGDQSIGASVSVLPMNIHLNWFNSDDKFGGLFCFRTKDKNICKMSLFLFYKLPLFLTYSINKFNWISVMSKY